MSEMEMTGRRWEVENDHRAGLERRICGRLADRGSAHVSEKPPSPFVPFEFHGCYCAAAGFKGSPPWELHTTGDELLYILAGSSSLTVRGPEGEMLRNLRAGDLVVVPKGCWHRNDAPDGVTMLVVTPREGNQHRWEDPATGGIVSPTPS
jgi:mannose-6-phosphate isomerase-like protein (cupin superfamily)